VSKVGPAVISVTLNSVGKFVNWRSVGIDRSRSIRSWKVRGRWSTAIEDKTSES